MPGVHNVIVLPGDHHLEALIRRAEGGLFVHELSGTHTINEVTGELSFGATGWAIRGGARREPFDGATVSGTLLELLSGPIHPSSDTRRVGSFRGPAILVESVQVSAAGDA
jgi:PmbA protein